GVVDAPSIERVGPHAGWDAGGLAPLPGARIPGRHAKQVVPAGLGTLAGRRRHRTGADHARRAAVALARLVGGVVVPARRPAPRGAGAGHHHGDEQHERAWVKARHETSPPWYSPLRRLVATARPHRPAARRRVSSPGAAS